MGQTDQRPFRQLRSTIVAPCSAQPTPVQSGRRACSLSGRHVKVEVLPYILLCVSRVLYVSPALKWEVGSRVFASGSLRRTLTMFGRCSGRPTGVLASPFHCSAIVVALLAGREPIPLVLARVMPAAGMPELLSCVFVDTR